MPDVLNALMGANDAEAETVGDYLRALLLGVWLGEDEFSGKRPFGNSGWKHEVIIALAGAGLIRGSYDPECEEWTIRPGEWKRGEVLVMEGIMKLFGSVHG